MSNTNNTAKIVVAALLGTLVAHDVILVRMLKEERLNAELYEREYRRVIDESCMKETELIRRIRELECEIEAAKEGKA